MLRPHASIVFDMNVAPTVGWETSLCSSFTNWEASDVFPTPEFPRRTSLTWSLVTVYVIFFVLFLQEKGGSREIRLVCVTEARDSAHLGLFLPIDGVVEFELHDNRLLRM
jgi:hypothetical protein